MTDDHWYHVTPLFLFAGIVQHRGLRCGADLEKVGLPRRGSSRDDDGKPIQQLDGRCAADCVLLFTTPYPPLLRNKIERRKGPWKAFPHIILHFPAAACMTAAGRKVYGSNDNVGRSLRRKKTPDVRLYTSYIALRNQRVEEVMIPADLLPNRTLAITLAACVECFSAEDQAILKECLERLESHLPVRMTEKQKYVTAQSEGPGSEYLQLTRDYYDAVWSEDKLRRDKLMAELARRCFD